MRLKREGDYLIKVSDLFHKNEHGDFVYGTDSVKPSIDVRKLEQYLASILSHITAAHPDQPIDPNLGKGAKFAQWAQVRIFIYTKIILKRLSNFSHSTQHFTRFFLCGWPWRG